MTLAGQSRNVITSYSIHYTKLYESAHPDSFKTRSTLEVSGKTYDYFSLKALAAAGVDGIDRLPLTLKILLENLLRHEDGGSVTAADIRAVVDWLQQQRSEHEIAFRPTRVLRNNFV